MIASFGVSLRTSTNAGNVGVRVPLIPTYVSAIMLDAMDYVSTADPNAKGTDLATALLAGLAPDGGLYVPRTLPTANLDALRAQTDLPGLATELLAPFCAGSRLEPALPEICREALNLPLPLPELGDSATRLMELFHGPTAAFKDFAARFLAACLAHLRAPGDAVRTVLVATSGDTGGAVAAAFHRRPGFRVVILYPAGRVSKRQAHQLGAFGNNVHAFRVEGDFDDCQRMVKQALNDPDMAEAFHLTSANSISLGRLLPQISYYAWAALQLTGDEPVNVIVPTGNLGNALACILARDMGLPIGEIFLATNANRTLPDYFSGQDYHGRPGLETLANAMDVGDPSNFERLAWFYRDRDLRAAGLHAESVDDEQIRQTIRDGLGRYQRVFCPHTACAVKALERRRASGDRRPFVVVATAHPAKFNEVVEPLIGSIIEPPPALKELLQRPSHAGPLAPTLDALLKVLVDFS